MRLMVLSSRRVPECAIIRQRIVEVFEYTLCLGYLIDDVDGDSKEGHVKKNGQNTKQCGRVVEE